MAPNHETPTREGLIQGAEGKEMHNTIASQCRLSAHEQRRLWLHNRVQNVDRTGYNGHIEMALLESSAHTEWPMGRSMWSLMNERAK